MEKKIALIAAACCIAGISQAQIINSSFELNFAGIQNLTSGTPIMGWSSGGSNQGSWDIRAFDPLNPLGTVPWGPFWTQFAPAGDQIAYVNFGPLAQQTGFTLQAGTQSFTVAAGRRGDRTGFGTDISADFAMEIWAGGTVSSGSVTGGTLLASQTVLMSGIASGTFQDFTVSHTEAAGSSLIGQLLTIRFNNISNAEQINIDNVRYTPVPEPMTMALLALGAGALAARRRKSRQA
jgi:hypothetical protein